MIQDFRFAFRQLLKSPGFTFIAVLTLALAIGVNSAVFALINGVVLRPMVPVRPQEVVNVFTARQNASHDYRQFSHAEFRELRENGREVFADVAALQFTVAGIGKDHEMRRSFAFLTSENFFSMMGTQPFRGRFYNAEESRPNANMPVVVASYRFWKRMGGRRRFSRQQPPDQRPALHRDRHHARWLQRNQRAHCARCLAPVRDVFPARLGLQRFGCRDGFGAAEELHAQPHRASAPGANARHGQVAVCRC